MGIHYHFCAPRPYGRAAARHPVPCLGAGDERGRPGRAGGHLRAPRQEHPDPVPACGAGARRCAGDRAAHPESPFPASWHRMVVARIAQEVLALAIAYPDQQEQQ